MTTIALSSDQIRLNAPNTYFNNLVVTGTINSDSGLNIGYKLPISFTTNRNININGITFSCYDIDLTLPPREYGGALVVWPGMPFPNLDGRIHQSLVF